MCADCRPSTTSPPTPEPLHRRPPAARWSATGCHGPGTASSHALSIMAMAQVRRLSAGQVYYQHKLAEGKSPKEALRCLKRRLSDAVYRCLVTDQAERPPAMAQGN
jgi:hypothetical protein